MLKCKHQCHCACSSEIGTCIFNDAGRHVARTKNKKQKKQQKNKKKTTRGGLWFFVSFRIFFGLHESQNRFFLSRKARKKFPEFNKRLYDKNSESYYFFFLHQNQNIFFSNIGNQNIFLEKNHNPSLQVKWSFPQVFLNMNLQHLL